MGRRPGNAPEPRRAREWLAATAAMPLLRARRKRDRPPGLAPVRGPAQNRLGRAAGQQLLGPEVAGARTKELDAHRFIAGEISIAVRSRGSPCLEPARPICPVLAPV